MPRFVEGKQLILILLGFCGPVLIWGCQPQETTQGETEQRLSAECVQDYDPEKNYFRDRTQPEYATGFSVTYHNHYKIVTVRNPWQDTDETFQYLLVQCGTPVPEGYEQMQVIKIPIQSVVTLSTTHLPHLDRLGVIDRLLGVSRFSIVNTATVQSKIEEGKLLEVGSGNTLNLERLVEQSPDLILTYGTGNPEFDRHQQMQSAGLSVAIVAEYMESSPLGRAEWIKFTALFFNQEAKAEAIFTKIAAQYEMLTQLTENIEDRPTVLTGFSYEGTWYVAGAESYVGQFLRDAGANYLWSDLDIAGSSPKDFEAVFARAKDAEYWLNVSQDWQSREDMVAADARYQMFTALQEDRVFNNTARLSPQGGNDYWETGMLEPDQVLADLIAILHPQLLPDRELKYYQKLD
ncbi:ABC transporter substrate-binding protein [Spirulina sp. CS-785/01]|uniref:ABC transporter substrate-binding protein n=1 Tax=Spirulina sp. CS-785/01 TaxID=3021716 RepID=UPI00232E31A8|nr:ABC transporter substrate-binding protein [Spirulina sp. CS-785/01]MDB9312296.1 ABC transporter substrate-binding protein [Spirulina sp. CS-785/01]